MLYRQLPDQLSRLLNERASNSSSNGNLQKKVLLKVALDLWRVVKIQDNNIKEENRPQKIILFTHKSLYLTKVKELT